MGTKIVKRAKILEIERLDGTISWHKSGSISHLGLGFTALRQFLRFFVRSEVFGKWQLLPLRAVDLLKAMEGSPCLDCSVEHHGLPNWIMGTGKPLVNSWLEKWPDVKVCLRLPAMEMVKARLVPQGFVLKVSKMSGFLKINQKILNSPPLPLVFVT